MPWKDNGLKVPFFTVLFVVVGLFILFRFAPISINSVQTNRSNLFYADGVGEASGIPTEATVIGGVSSEGETVEEAQEEANSISQRILEALRNAGIEEEDIKTTNYSVSENFEPIPIEGRDQGTSGYQVSHNLEVTLQDSERTGEITDIITSNGGNVVEGVTFRLSEEERENLEEEAMREAVEDAKEKAQRLADASGIRLGRLLEVQKTPTDGQPIPLRSAEQRLDTPTQLEPGESTVRVQVTLGYEIR